jgi:RNA polymerase sigma factor (sigma-70 family)
MLTRSPVPAALGDEPVLFREHHPRLRSHVGRVVRTSRANVEDACSFAFLQLLRHQPDREHVYGWLLRAAIREAIKLDQQARRAVPLPHAADDHRTWELADERARSEVSVELLAAREAVAAAGTTAREWRIVGLRAIGLSYTEVSRVTGDSARTVERQLLRGRHKLRAARARQGG